MNLVFVFACLFACQDQGGGIRTPDMDPHRNPLDLKKEFPRINRKADAVLKQLESFTAVVKQRDQEKNVALEGSLKAKVMKGKLWVLMTLADHPGGWTQENIAGTKVTWLWPGEKICRKIDYQRNRKAHPVELFYAVQYHPLKLAKNFTITPFRIASDYRKIDTIADNAPEEDPILEKAKRFENRNRQQKDLPPSGPDPKLYHGVDLTPRSKTLRDTMARVRVWFHYKTFLISRIEVYQTVDGSPVVVSELTDYKVGVELKNSEVLIKTVGWKKKSD